MVNTNVRFCRLPDTCRIAGIGKSQVFSLQREGKFPPAIKLSPRVTVWREDELLAWVEARTVEARGLSARCGASVAGLVSKS